MRAMHMAGAMLSSLAPVEINFQNEHKNTHLIKATHLNI